MRRIGIDRADLRIAVLHRPDHFPGAGVQREQRAVRLLQEDLVLSVGEAPVHGVAAHLRYHRDVLLRLVAPLDLLRVEVDGEHLVGERRMDVHHAVHHQRRAFVAAEHAGGKHPGNLHLADVLRVDLRRACCNAGCTYPRPASPNCWGRQSASRDRRSPRRRPEASAPNLRVPMPTALKCLSLFPPWVVIKPKRRAIRLKLPGPATPIDCRGSVILRSTKVNLHTTKLKIFRGRNRRSILLQRTTRGTLSFAPNRSTRLRLMAGSRRNNAPQQSVRSPRLPVDAFGSIASGRELPTSPRPAPHFVSPAIAFGCRRRPQPPISSQLAFRPTGYMRSHRAACARSRSHQLQSRRSA